MSSMSRNPEGVPVSACPSRESCSSLSSSSWRISSIARKSPRRRLLLDERPIVARVSSGGDARRELVHVRLASRGVEVAPFLELGADGERVDRLLLLVQGQDGAE